MRTSEKYHAHLLSGRSADVTHFGASRHDDPIPTNAALESGLQQCAEFGLDTILVFVPLPTP